MPAVMRMLEEIAGMPIDPQSPGGKLIELAQSTDPSNWFVMLNYVHLAAAVIVFTALLFQHWLTASDK